MGLGKGTLMNSYPWKYYDLDGTAHDWAVGATLPNGADLTKLAFLNQFVSAYRRIYRGAAFTNQTWSGMTTPVISPYASTQLVDWVAPGDDVFKTYPASYADSGVIRQLQYNIGNLYGLIFADTYNGVPVRGLLKTGADSDIDHRASDNLNIMHSSDFYTATGLNYFASFMFRYSLDGTTVITPVYPPTDSNGFFREGHAVGPWIFEDLQRVLDFFKVPVFGHLGISAAQDFVYQFFMRTCQATPDGWVDTGWVGQAIGGWPPTWPYSVTILSWYGGTFLEVTTNVGYALCDNWGTCPGVTLKNYQRHSNLWPGTEQGTWLLPDANFHQVLSTYHASGSGVQYFIPFPTSSFPYFGVPGASEPTTSEYMYGRGCFTADFDYETPP